MSGPPWPEAFVARLERIAPGFGAELTAACWDGERFVDAPKTAVVLGDAGLRAAAIEELAAGGFMPEPLEEALDGDALLCRIDVVGRHVAALDGHRFGLLYLQERSSFHYLTRALAALDPRRTVLDFCAAPGGKAVLLARYAERIGGRLHANEPVVQRRQGLKVNLRRCGAPEETTVSGYDHRAIPPAWRSGFELVLVDAPCSGEGLLRRRDAHGLPFWRPGRVKRCARLEGAIASALVDCVAPGGDLIYSTCTFAPEENEVQLEELVAAHPHLEARAVPGLVGATAPVARWDGRALEHAAAAARFVPRREAPGEGFFGAHLADAGGSAAVSASVPGLRPLWYDVAGFVASDAAETPRSWPSLAIMHADAFRRQSDIARPTDLEPTLAALREWLARAAPFRKTGAPRVVLWRHLVLLVEAPLARGRTFVRRHPALAAYR